MHRGRRADGDLETMRHNKETLKLGRTAEHRRALFRNLLSSLFLHGSLITTDAKAKELKRRADRLIGWAREGTLGARRLAAAELFGAKPLKVLFDHWGPQFRERSSGFTRLVKVGRRPGDGASQTLVELIGGRPGTSQGGETPGAD